MRRPAALLALFLLPASLRANDGAASVAAGGLRLQAERRVAMITEHLFISQEKVQVDYDFLNQSDHEVVTEVAFPIPEYGLGPEFSYHPFDRFSVRLDGAAVPYKVEIQAWADGRNLTRLLRSLGVDIESFALIQYAPEATRFPSQLQHLGAAALGTLRRAGAISGPDDVPRWTVRKTYHWTQHFPAGKTVHLSHAYAPVSGFTVGGSLAELAAPAREASPWLARLGPGCPDAGLQDWVAQRLAERQPRDTSFMKDRFHLAWVQYVLTTANTWQTPIRDFQLDVQGAPGERITFCWDGALEQVAPGRVRVAAKDFVPYQDLTVYFLKF